MIKANLVLSGGGMRGYAHVGIVKALLEKKIHVCAISGTSSGALIGAFLCDGFHPDEIEHIILKQQPQIGFNYKIFSESLLTFSSFTEVLKKNLRSKKIEQLKTPLHIALTNLNTGRQEIVKEGNLLDALTASAAIPVLLPSVSINSIPYADGGMSNNLPVEPFLRRKEMLIGSHVNPLPDYQKKVNLIQNADRSMHLIMQNKVQEGKEHCDVFIEPPALKKFHLFESKKAREIIRQGYEFVKTEMNIPLIPSKT
jgi:NTE family protein